MEIFEEPVLETFEELVHEVGLTALEEGLDGLTDMDSYDEAWLYG